jgi:hypothetical protein
LPAALFDVVCFFLVFFLAAIRAVYHRHKCGTKPLEVTLQKPNSAAS